MAHGATLPVKPETGGKVAEGYSTPKADQLVQRMVIPPKRVLPIVFLPGIMGSNLRMSAARQSLLKKSNNMAWRPEDKTESLALVNASAARRQSQLDPDTTEVDSYDPVTNPTGDKDETSYERHDNVKLGSYYVRVGINTPLLMSDDRRAANSRTREQKARERGWGEVYYSSYRELLEMCEAHLNQPYIRPGQPTAWWKSEMLGISPQTWQALREFNLAPLDEPMLRQAVTGCWFPVHAMGYNWLKSNRDSGEAIAQRIEALIKRYVEQGYQCEKVIVVTHSMGGLVARALIHPEMGNLKSKVLGMVHGVMPATGAGAGYKRMRCGFEGWLLDIGSKVCGNMGPEVTAILGNAQGGLELLPSRAYGNAWLQVRHQDSILLSLPKDGDPYEEIYKVKNKWYGLVYDEKWLNPAGLPNKSLSKTHKLLDAAKAFHNAIENTFHEQSYAHYGNDLTRRAWHHVLWDISLPVASAQIDLLRLTGDSLQGELTLTDPSRQPNPSIPATGQVKPPPAPVSRTSILQPASALSGLTGPVPSASPAKGAGKLPSVPNSLTAILRPATDAGDLTVPVHSANGQHASGKFKGIFRQTGYEHQSSYSDNGALRSTLYSIVQIARTMSWSK
jgi:pimeloyl-ACP methyl ester carboxylesterase